MTSLRHLRQGLQAATLHPYDVALVDQTVPDMDVRELVRQLRAQIRDIEVILMSAYSDETSNARAVEAGAFACLPKPCRLATLHCAVESAIVAHRASVAPRDANRENPRNG